MRYVGVIVGLLCVTSGGTAWAGPVVREASGPTAASIQAAVDQFRADLGPNNGVATGSQPGGRREINWDGGGAAARTHLRSESADAVRRARRDVRHFGHRVRNERRAVA